MAYSVVTATDIADLFGELELFAEAQGWTVVWNTGAQIGLNNAKNCYAAWGVDGTTNPAVETDTYPDPDVTVFDGRIYGSLGKNFVGHASQYWGLTGSPVTGATDNDRVMVNDLTGPFSEVHFFGDDEYIWVVVRSAADRYTHFGFGSLDKKGMTHPDCAFMCGMFHRYWDNNQQNGFEIKRNLNYTQGDFGNKYWFKDGYGDYLSYVPDGVLDPAYGIADDVIDKKNWSNAPALWYQGARADYSEYNNARLMDHWPFALQKPVTGGLPLLSFPILWQNGTSGDSLLCFLGDLPGIRLCNVDTVAIGEDIVYGAETYLAFPVKRRTGSSYDGRASTYGLGVAFKKD